METTEILVVPLMMNGIRWEEPYDSIHWNILKEKEHTAWAERHCDIE